jgi:hypothetical protein
LHQKENKDFEKVAFYEFTQTFVGHYEHIQSPPTPSRKILFDPLKILQKNTGQNLGLAGLLAFTEEMGVGSIFIAHKNKILREV